ncbi:MAG: cytochrome c biogenesis protein CcsA [Magnetospirillum sp. WYHS-4]
MESMLFSLSALLALVPVSVASVKRAAAGPDGLFRLLLGVAVAGPLLWAAVQMAGAWRTGLSTALWVTVAASMALFAATALTTRHAWRLTPLIGPYMILLGLVALVWQHVPAHRPLGAEGAVALGWVGIHIAVSVATYGLVTIAAVAALAAFLQEKALKAKQPTALTRLLPSVMDSERLVVRLLLVGEGVLALGLATGMATQYGETGRFLVLDHKTVLTVASFLVIGGLLVAHFVTGLRGRVVARIVLLAYLLISLGYPGVKLVTDVILA